MPPPRFIINITPVDDTDWLEACYIGMPAQHFGRFYIYGSHIKDPVPEGLLPVLVDAATAFGSGEHPTTAGCLKLLSRLSDTHNFKTILDMGCGSGILGIASKKCWPQASVILADNDAESVRVATLNASANQADITCYQSEGFSNSLITNAGPFDLTLANILAKPLCDLAPDFMQHTSSKGYVIVSGLLSRQGELVTNAFLNAGFKLYDSLLIEDWLSLVFQKV
jgi:ribosomal protein L11 methyltransferase